MDKQRGILWESNSLFLFFSIKGRISMAWGFKCDKYLRNFQKWAEKGKQTRSERATLEKDGRNAQIKVRMSNG